MQAWCDWEDALYASATGYVPVPDNAHTYDVHDSMIISACPYQKLLKVHALVMCWVACRSCTFLPPQSDVCASRKPEVAAALAALSAAGRAASTPAAPPPDPRDSEDEGPHGANQWGRLGQRDEDDQAPSRRSSDWFGHSDSQGNGSSFQGGGVGRAEADALRMPSDRQTMRPVAAQCQEWLQRGHAPQLCVRGKCATVQQDEHSGQQHTDKRETGCLLARGGNTSGTFSGNQAQDTVLSHCSFDENQAHCSFDGNQAQDSMLAHCSQAAQEQLESLPAAEQAQQLCVVGRQLSARAPLMPPLRGGAGSCCSSSSSSSSSRSMAEREAYAGDAHVRGLLSRRKSTGADRHSRAVGGQEQLQQVGLEGAPVEEGEVLAAHGVLQETLAVQFDVWEAHIAPASHSSPSACPPAADSGPSVCQKQQQQQQQQQDQGNGVQGAWAAACLHQSGRGGARMDEREPACSIMAQAVDQVCMCVGHECVGEWDTCLRTDLMQGCQAQTRVA